MECRTKTLQLICGSEDFPSSDTGSFVVGHYGSSEKFRLQLNGADFAALKKLIVSDSELISAEIL